MVRKSLKISGYFMNNVPWLIRLNNVNPWFVRWVVGRKWQRSGSDLNREKRERYDETEERKRYDGKRQKK